MIIDCISDLHGAYPNLEGGDLLIVAGDLTAHDRQEEYGAFLTWCIGRLDKQYKKLIFIPGNHDGYIYECYKQGKIFNPMFPRLSMLCDSGTEFQGLKIWGSPWSRSFEGINPHCKAFTVDTEEELAEKWSLIPNDTDILITHSPMYNYLDKCLDFEGKPKYCGSPSLRLRTREMMIKDRSRIKLHVCGHIHEGYGQEGDIVIPIRVNASHVNECYEPVNPAIRIIL